jgi:hypothetical protein
LNLNRGVLCDKVGAQPEGQYLSVDGRRQQVPEHLRRVLDQRMPGWAVTTSQMAAITGSVADLEAAHKLLADVEAVTGSRFAAARTRNSGDRLVIGHKCRRAVDSVAIAGCKHTSKTCSRSALVDLTISSAYGTKLGYITKQAEAGEDGDVAQQAAVDADGDGPQQAEASAGADGEQQVEVCTIPPCMIPPWQQRCRTQCSWPWTGVHCTSPTPSCLWPAAWVICCGDAHESPAV